MTDHVIEKLGPFDIPHVGPRHVRVYVPPGPPAHRSVLYVFDGQNIFHDAPSYAGGWHLHATTRRLTSPKRAAPIVVGIDHGGAARVDELGGWAKGDGRTDALLDWMAATLLPRIRADHGASADPAHVGIGGSSMGGLGALYAHFKRPELFGLVLAMSPSLWFANGKIFELIAAASKPWTSRIYLDAGGLEGAGRMLAAAQRLADQLRARGWDDASLQLVAAKRGTHSEKHWRKRAPDALRFLFSLGPDTKKKRAKRAV
jgi:enterochelin esterase-like enzyme